MIGKKLRTVCALAASLLLVGTGASAVYGESKPAASPYRIVALGDSVTVGYEPGMSVDSIPYGYAERLHEQALFHGRATLDNFGIVGLRSEGLLKLVQGASDGKKLKSNDLQDFSMYDERVALLADQVAGRTADLKQSLAEAELVVMTIGGNDFSHFLMSLKDQSMDNVAKSLDNDYTPLLNQYLENVEKSIRLVSAMAPNAQIWLTDQYLPLPRLFAADLYDKLYEKAVEPLTAAIDGLSAKLRADGIQAGSVHLAELFKGKEGVLTHMSVTLGSDEKPDIHPNQKGYAVIAEAFAQTVWKEYRNPSPRPAGVPISVIVGGKELDSPYKPTLKNNTTFVALSDVAAATGAELQWIGKTRTAVFRQNGREVSITIGANTLTVDGVQQQLAAPAYLQKIGKEDKTYVPLAVIVSGLKYDVFYSKKLQAAFINP